MDHQLLQTPTLSATTFNKIRQLVYEIGGISLNDNKESLVKARIAKRMRKLNIGDYDEYFNHVLNDPSGIEIQILLDAISTNTTSFYREIHHFEFMRQIIKDWQKSGLRSLRIWSAASSSGEEPYTIAIELSELLGGQQLFGTKILATDINTTVLTAAQKGQYTAERVEPVPKQLLQKYFTKSKFDDETIYSVSDKLKKMIIYRQFNLTKRPFPVRPDLDIIFCRNVMIYFDAALRAMLAEEFSRILKPGGYLFVGHAESLTGMTKTLKCIKPSIYQKGR